MTTILTHWALEMDQRRGHPKQTNSLCSEYQTCNKWTKTKSHLVRFFRIRIIYCSHREQ